MNFLSSLINSAGVRVTTIRYSGTSSYESCETIDTGYHSSANQYWALVYATQKTLNFGFKPKLFGLFSVNPDLTSYRQGNGFETFLSSMATSGSTRPLMFFTEDSTFSIDRDSAKNYYCIYKNSVYRAIRSTALDKQTYIGRRQAGGTSSSDYNGLLYTVKIDFLDSGCAIRTEALGDGTTEQYALDAAQTHVRSDYNYANFNNKTYIAIGLA